MFCTVITVFALSVAASIPFAFIFHKIAYSIMGILHLKWIGIKKDWESLPGIRHVAYTFVILFFSSLLFTLIVFPNWKNCEENKVYQAITTPAIRTALGCCGGQK